MEFDIGLWQRCYRYRLFVSAGLIHGVVIATGGGGWYLVIVVIGLVR